MHKVSSSSIDEYAYHHETKIMRIKFKNGKTYDYHDVPIEKHHAFVLAPSKGSFVNKHIVGLHRHEKIA